MAVQLRRPILVGGIALSSGLWLLQSLYSSIDELIQFGVLGAIALGGGLWLVQRYRPKNPQKQPALSSVDRATVEKAIAQAAGVVRQLVVEAENQEGYVLKLQEQVAQLQTELDRQEVKLAVTGGKAVGKTALIKVLKDAFAKKTQGPLLWQETPALLTGLDADLSAETAAVEVALASDLVLFVTNGDLTDSEFQILQRLRTANQRTVLVFNKQDHYLPDERAVVLLTLYQRLERAGREALLVREEDVVAVTASPLPVKVRQHQADGTVQEWLEQPEPNTEQLTNRLAEILTQEERQLVWATTMRAAFNLKAEGKTLLNQLRRNRAVPVIEQCQWIAATAAFANPVPSLDLLATAAINAQLIVELGGIYQQKFSLQQAQTVAGTLGSLMLKLGLVELSTQTIGTILKSNAITFLAGGTLQGISAAYLTRIAGLSLIEYFQVQELETGKTLNLDQLKQTLQKVFQQNQQVAFFQSLVKQTVGRLMPESP